MDGAALSFLDRTRAAYAWQLRLASADLDAWLADIEALVETVVDDGQAHPPGHLASARAAYVECVQRELCSLDARLEELARLSAWLVGAVLSERPPGPSSADAAPPTSGSGRACGAGIEAAASRQQRTRRLSEDTSRDMTWHPSDQERGGITCCE
jgi:hypothetical protein